MAQLPKPILDLINAFERLPGIGPKSATRMAFYLLNTPQSFVDDFATVLTDFKKKIKICSNCYAVSDSQLCSICADEKRQKNIICVVERAIDVMALENVGGFKGVYHVLGGVINPLDHVSPEDLKIEELLERVRSYQLQVKDEERLTIEIILATNPTMEGEATALFIKKKIEQNFQIPNSNFQIKISRIGSGLPLGADMEFADAGTLARAMEGRREI